MTWWDGPRRILHTCRLTSGHPDAGQLRLLRSTAPVPSGWSVYCSRWETENFTASRWFNRQFRSRTRKDNFPAEKPRPSRKPCSISSVPACCYLGVQALKHRRKQNHNKARRSMMAVQQLPPTSTKRHKGCLRVAYWKKKHKKRCKFLQNVINVIRVKESTPTPGHEHFSAPSHAREYIFF